MAVRVSGFNGSLMHKRTGVDYALTELIQISTDRRARANEYSLPESTPTIVDTSGYGQHTVEPVPIGMSTLGSVSITLHWDSSASGLILYLNDMYERQHQAAACTTAVEDWLVAMPEGKCAGKQFIKYNQAMIANKAPQTPLDNVLMFGTSFRVWEEYSGRIELVDFDISVASGTASPAPTETTVENFIWDYFLDNINADDDFTQSGFETALAVSFPNVGSVTWTAPSTATTSPAATGNILIPGTISVTIT
jgi:hypothetical protein